MKKTLWSLYLLWSFANAQTASIDLNGFEDSAHHWYDITDETSKIIMPLPGKPRYTAGQVKEIADNILLYQRSNGGWPKNYDMQAILTNDQKEILLKNKNDNSQTTFDNGATHAQLEYLAHAYAATKEDRYKSAFLHGIDFISSAQYHNGGWPQFYPDTSRYRKYITFNDGAMAGIMELLYNVVYIKKDFDFIDDAQRRQIEFVFQKGIQCILECQITVNGIPTVWCQQHDNIDLRPQHARTFEPAALCSQESSELVLFLMKIKNPSHKIIDAVNNAVAWFERSAIHGMKVETIKAEKTEFKYHTADFDKVVVEDLSAPPIWSRLYEIETNKPLFCNRDGHSVYSLAEVERERRTGYGWYGYEPAKVLKKYAAWQKKWSPEKNVLESR
ncbi:MAG: pectate lyase [Bacteroidota bacterium]